MLVAANGKSKRQPLKQKCAACIARQTRQANWKSTSDNLLQRLNLFKVRRLDMFCNK